jgi:hypothetical protein
VAGSTLLVKELLAVLGPDLGCNQQKKNGEKEKLEGFDNGSMMTHNHKGLFEKWLVSRLAAKIR